MTPKEGVNRFIKLFSALKFTCDICGAETFDYPICAECLKDVTLNDGNTCPTCGRRTFRPELCMECKQKPPMFKAAVSPFVYSGTICALIQKFKNGYAYLAEFLGEQIVEKLVGFPKIDAIVYVPQTKTSSFRRGYNQSKLLAEKVSKLTCTPKIDGAIIKIKKGKPQKSLTKAQRIENIKGQFKVVKRDEIKGKSLLLVDDVMTTGATADELALILRAAGAREVFLATAASVEYMTIERQALLENDKNGNN